MTQCTQSSTFKLVTNLGEAQLLNELEANLKMFFDWALLCIGGWNNVTSSAGDLYGGDLHSLRSTIDPSYTDGRVWQGLRTDWVWETGISYEGTGNPQPLQITGVEVGGTPMASGYYINYPLGRVVFDSPVSTSSEVTLSYSYRSIQVQRADDAKWWQELQYQSSKSTNVHFTQDANTGDWSIGGQHRVQLPAIIIEAVPRGSSRGYELGNGALVVEQDVLFHILAETRAMRNDLTDVCRLQTDKVIWLFDTDAVVAGGDLPLDYRGMLVGDKMYPDLVDATNGYRWKKCLFKSALVSEVDSIHPMLHESVVRVTCEIVIGSI
jgi:hypothetical protein